jgi:hypothetical protein
MNNLFSHTKETAYIEVAWEGGVKESICIQEEGSNWRTEEIV